MINLLEDSILCYLSLSKLSNWLNNNNLWEEIAGEKNLLLKEKWKKELDFNLPRFFIDSELLFMKDDMLLLQIGDKNHAEFLLKTYRLEEQEFCQKLFGENKNIIVLTESEWKKLMKFKENNKEDDLEKENCLIFFKDEESNKKSLSNWLKNLTEQPKSRSD